LFTLFSKAKTIGAIAGAVAIAAIWSISPAAAEPRLETTVQIPDGGSAVETASEPLTESLESTNASDIMEPAAEPITGTTETATETIAEPLAETVAPVAEAVNEAAAPVVKPAAETAAPITEAVAPVAEPITEAIALVVQPVAETLAPVTEALTPVAEPITEAIAVVVQPVAETLAPVIEAVAPVGEHFTASAPPAVDASAETRKPVIETFAVDGNPPPLQQARAAETSVPSIAMQSLTMSGVDPGRQFLPDAEEAASSLPLSAARLDYNEYSSIAAPHQPALASEFRSSDGASQGRSEQRGLSLVAHTVQSAHGFGTTIVEHFAVLLAVSLALLSAWQVLLFLREFLRYKDPKYLPVEPPQ
jgi:hypothetical protein